MSVLISYGFYFLIWVVFVPLIYLAFKKNCKEMILHGLIYGLITSVLFFDWVYDIKLNYNVQLYTLIIFIVTAYFALFLAAIAFLSKRIKNNFVFLLPAVVWMLMLFAYSLLPIEIYWMDITIFQPNLVPMIWILGSYGITFFIILFNSVIAYCFIRKNKYVVFFGIFLLIIVLISLLYGNYFDFSGNGSKLRVALLQGNFPYGWEWRQKNAFNLILDTYLNMTTEASKEKPDIIIWPEYSLPEDITRNYSVFANLQKTAKRLNITLIVGSLSYVEGKKYHDTAFVFKPDGSFDLYSSLKPFFFDKEVVKGNTANIIQHYNHKFGIIVCNEESIQSLTRGYASNGTEFIVSLSNNQDYGRGRPLIAQFTRLRAAENAKYVVRATNDGITQIINPFGKVVYSAEPKKQKILIGDIYVNNYQTFYTKYGNFFVYLFMVLSIILILKKR